MSNWKIPLSDLDYGPEEGEAVARVLRSKWLSMGGEVEAFEHEFASCIGSKHAIAVSNGTAALHLALLALQVGTGDEVIQPAVNFVAAANMTLAVGAMPVFGDIIGIEEPTINPDQIRSRITPKTRAVIVMHYGGYLARMKEILEICRERNIPVIEDACHAVGAQYTGGMQKNSIRSMAGNLGDIGCFSFFSNKNLAVGEGGMVTTNRDDLASIIRLLRSHGMTAATWDRHKGHAYSYDVVANGYNYRLDELHAALGRVQLSKLRDNNRTRRNLVASYQQKLDALPGCIFPFFKYSGDSACHLAVLAAANPGQRSQIVRALSGERIQTSLHYPFIPGFAAFQKLQCGNGDSLDNSREFSKRAITLPLFVDLSPGDILTICRIINQAVKEPELESRAVTSAGAGTGENADITVPVPSHLRGN